MLKIENEEQLEEALEKLNVMWFSEKGSSEWEELVDAIEIYENEHYPIPEPDEEERKQFRKEQEGL